MTKWTHRNDMYHAEVERMRRRERAGNIKYLIALLLFAIFYACFGTLIFALWLQVIFR